MVENQPDIFPPKFQLSEAFDKEWKYFKISMVTFHKSDLQ